jgi:hypothetical protein
MAPTVVVVSTWQPDVNSLLSDPAGFNSSRSFTAVWENKFDVHLDTPCNDPVIRKLGAVLRVLTPGPALMFSETSGLGFSATQHRRETHTMSPIQ